MTYGFVHPKNDRFRRLVAPKTFFRRGWAKTLLTWGSKRYSMPRKCKSWALRIIEKGGTTRQEVVKTMVKWRWSTSKSGARQFVGDE